MLHEDNLLCVRRRTFVTTTDSRHGLPVYPNLARGMDVTAVNQLWVADITYIRLPEEFVYLAVLLDSRELKITAMRACDAGSTTGEIARKYQLAPKLLERWRGEWGNSGR